MGSTQGLSSAYHPSTNGAAERANAMIERYLWSYTYYQQTEWVEFIAFAEFAYNNTVHSSTGYSPFYVVNGMEFKPIANLLCADTLPCNVTDWSLRVRECWQSIKIALDKSSEKVKKQADKKRQVTKEFKVGDKVYLSTKYIKLKFNNRKLGPKYIGPFTIEKIINPVTVTLVLPSWLGCIHPVFHINLLKEWVNQKNIYMEHHIDTSNII
uniref:Integrase catalytic domain-containing protein n=1 Tax=Micrurus surinamensis TaxID=129470 RepID=A0A2D4PUB1_MICSU